MARLEHLAALHVAGPDAGTFLDAQFTRRVTGLAPGELALAAWCNPDGRVRALLRVLQSEAGDFLLVLPRALAAGVGLALGRFVLRSRVHIAPAPLPVWVIRAEPKAEPTLPAARLLAAGAHPRAPERSLAVTSEGPAPAGGPAAAPATGTETMSAADLAWRREDILAGLPQIHPATSGHWLPQSLDLEALGGLAYDKGCYPGQEIVARVHYRGVVKQRLCLLTETVATGAVAPEAGTPLTDAAGQLQGEVLDAVRNEADGRVYALAVVGTAAAAGPLRTAGDPAGSGLLLAGTRS